MQHMQEVSFQVLDLLGQKVTRKLRRLCCEVWLETSHALAIQERLILEMIILCFFFNAFCLVFRVSGAVLLLLTGFPSRTTDVPFRRVRLALPTLCPQNTKSGRCSLQLSTPLRINSCWRHESRDSFCWVLLFRSVALPLFSSGWCCSANSLIFETIVLMYAVSNHEM